MSFVGNLLFKGVLLLGFGELGWLILDGPNTIEAKLREIFLCLVVYLVLEVFVTRPCGWIIAANPKASDRNKWLRRLIPFVLVVLWLTVLVLGHHLVFVSPVFFILSAIVLSYQQLTV